MDFEFKISKRLVFIKRIHIVKKKEVFVGKIGTKIANQLLVDGLWSSNVITVLTRGFTIFFFTNFNRFRHIFY